MFANNLFAGISLDAIMAVIGLIAIYFLLKENKERNAEDEEKEKRGRWKAAFFLDRFFEINILLMLKKIRRNLICKKKDKKH